MEELTTFLLLPPVQGFLGGALVILIKMMVDWFNKTPILPEEEENCAPMKLFMTP